MTTTFSLSSTEFDQSIIEKIQSITEGRKFKITIQLEEQGVGESAHPVSDKNEGEAVAYSKKLFSGLTQKKSAVDQILSQYKHLKIDLSRFKFNREEANER